MEPSDSPDSTTVNTDRPKVPPLILIGDRVSSACSSASVKNHSLISRVSYNSATNSYSHVPAGNSEPSPKMIIIPNKLERSLSYMIKDVDSSGTSSSSSNKTTYGSQSRTSLPVRNFLKPPLNSTKFEKQRRVYSSPGVASSSRDSSKDSINHEVEPPRHINSHTRPLTSFLTSSAENPNQSIKIHIRRNPDHDSAQLIVESPDSSIDSNDSNALDCSKNSHNTDSAPPSANNSVTNNSYVSSADDSSLTPVNSFSRENNCKNSNSVIRQLHPEFLKQVEKQAHDKVVEIAIDDRVKNQENHTVEEDQLDEDSGEYMDTEEPDDTEKVSNSEVSNVNSETKSRNTITIEIGDNGVISESGTIQLQGDDSRRTKRKRKPTKQYIPELIPRLKIRRKNDPELEGSSGPSFSFETVDDKEPKVDSTSSVDIKLEDREEDGFNQSETDPAPTKKPGRGRPKGSSNKPKLNIPLKPPGTGRGRGRPRGSTNKNKVGRREKLRDLAPDNVPSSTDTAVVSTTTGDEEKLETIVQVDIPLVPVEFMTEEMKQGVSVVSSTPSRRGRGGPRGPRLRGGARGGARRPAQPRKPREKKEKKVRKARKVVEKQPKVVTPVQVFEEETRMSADIKPPVTIPSSPAPTPTPAPIDEESVGASNVSSTSTSATGTIKMKKFTKDLVPDRKPVTAETLYEYCWPQTGPTGGEMFMLQEQVCEFLGVKSFKRKYPDLKRRIVDMEERDFLRSLKIVSETQCDLGLTALCSSDVLDIMFNDFPEKYEEFNKVLQERKEKELVKLKGATTPTATPPVRDRTAEFYRRCLKSTAKWNGILNRQRREERQCSFDLQTFTLHYQKGRMKVLPPEATKVGHYPVTVLPGQYCDYFKPYTADELKYLPLNTVLYGPVRPRLPVEPTEWQSEDEDVSSSSEYSSSSDDSGSSSDDESSSDSEECVKSFGDKENVVNSSSVVRFCKTCEGDHTKNKDGQAEHLLHCTKCDVPNHPSCLELRIDMLPFIKKYNWQCTDCKNCIECNDPADEDKMLFCDLCDRGYHIYCVGLRKVPTGRWHCRVCSVCFSCGCTQPSPDDRLAEWHHEFRKGEKNSRHFTHSLCVSCHKLYKKGQYCPSCLKVHLKLDDNKNLAECRSCEKWVHKECIKRPLQSMFGFMCDPCDAAFRSKTKLPPLVT